MALIVEPNKAMAETLGRAIGPASTALASLERAHHWLSDNSDEYAVVVGPSVGLDDAVAFADTLRVSRPPLGVILVRDIVDTAVMSEALKSGMRDVVPTRELDDVGTAVAKAQTIYAALTANEVAPRPGRRGTLITVFSSKGGVGKTTISTNLAAALADAQQSVCIVDLDLASGDVSIVLQLFPIHTIADALGMQTHLDAGAVEGLLTAHSRRLKALVAPVQPDAKDRIKGDLIGRVLSILKERFDVVVVDTPPAFDDVVLQAFDESDLLLLVANLDVPALKSLKVTTETLTLLSHPRDRWRLILNRADAKVGLTASDVEQALGLTISASIPQSDDVSASINQGMPIVLSHPRHPVSVAIRQIAGDCVAAGSDLATAREPEGRRLRWRRASR